MTDEERAAYEQKIREAITILPGQSRTKAFVGKLRDYEVSNWAPFFDSWVNALTPEQQESAFKVLAEAISRMAPYEIVKFIAHFHSYCCAFAFPDSTSPNVSG